MSDTSPRPMKRPHNNPLHRGIAATVARCFAIGLMAMACAGCWFPPVIDPQYNQSTFVHHQQVFGTDPAETRRWNSMSEQDRDVLAHAWTMNPGISMDQALWEEQNHSANDTERRDRDRINNSFRSHVDATGSLDPVEKLQWETLDWDSKRLIAASWDAKPTLTLAQAIADSKKREPELWKLIMDGPNWTPTVVDAIQAQAASEAQARLSLAQSPMRPSQDQGFQAPELTDNRRTEARTGISDPSLGANIQLCTVCTPPPPP